MGNHQNTAPETTAETQPSASVAQIKPRRRRRRQRAAALQVAEFAFACLAFATHSLRLRNREHAIHRSRTIAERLLERRRTASKPLSNLRSLGHPRRW